MSQRLVVRVKSIKKQDRKPLGTQKAQGHVTVRGFARMQRGVVLVTVFSYAHPGDKALGTGGCLFCPGGALGHLRRWKWSNEYRV